MIQSNRSFGFILILLITNVHLVIAQTETTTWKYQLDLDEKAENQMFIPEQRNNTYLKLTNPNRDESYHYTLGNTIREGIFNKKFNIYKSHLEVSPLSGKEVEKTLDNIIIDTIYTFDPDSYEEKVAIVKSKESTFPNQNTIYRLFQNWSFNNKKQELNSVVSGIDVVSGFKEMGEEKHLFTIKNKAKRKSINTKKLLKKKRIVWAKSITYSASFEDEELRELLMSRKHIKSHKVVNTIDNELMTLAEINELIAGSVDTIMDYKSDVYDPEISIVRNEALTGKNVKHFKIIQDFYYDKKKNVLLTKIIAIAPSIKKYDEMDNYLYTLPLFWIMYD